MLGEGRTQEDRTALANYKTKVSLAHYKAGLVCDACHEKPIFVSRDTILLLEQVS